ncbi:hypothetical protein KJ652_02735 [Patescibacteria group bacterium]|nr:hypothetical protein [Patescibacteria group bacterium]MBU1123482.1 hypothetical protein [Patescibacteria group bacterium]
MSAPEQESIVSNQSLENLESTVLRITLNGEADEVAEVLRVLRGSAMALTDYSIAPGELLGTTEMTVTIPARSRGLLAINQAKPVEEHLEGRIKSVLRVKRVKDVARHHVRLVINPEHPDMREVVNEICRIGGHSRIRKANRVTLRANETQRDIVLAVANTVPGLVQRGRVNSVYSMVDHDAPIGEEVDVSNSPDFSADAKRYGLNFACLYQLGNDAEIIDILSAAGFRIASMTSRIRENSLDLQDITIMLHKITGTESKLRRVMADISSLAEGHVNFVDESGLSQYMQGLFPLNMKDGLAQVRKSHPYFDNRGRIAAGLQLPASGSSLPSRQARLNKSLAREGLPRRLSPAIVDGSGVPLRSEENRFHPQSLEDRTELGERMIAMLKGLRGKFDTNE